MLMGISSCRHRKGYSRLKGQGARAMPSPLSLLTLSPKHLTHTHVFPPLSQGSVFFHVDSKLTFKHPLLSCFIHLYSAPVFFLNHQNG